MFINPYATSSVAYPTKRHPAGRYTQKIHHDHTPGYIINDSLKGRARMILSARDFEYAVGWLYQERFLIRKRGWFCVGGYIRICRRIEIFLLSHHGDWSSSHFCLLVRLISPYLISQRLIWIIISLYQDSTCSWEIWSQELPGKWFSFTHLCSSCNWSLCIL